jgi:hypothetical protein
MNKTKTTVRSRLFPLLGAGIAGGMLAAALTGCTTTSPQQRQEDIKSCSRKGLPYGSQDNYNCMMREKLYRDRTAG